MKELKSFIDEIIVCQDMMVKIEDLVFDDELYLSVHLHRFGYSL